MIPVEALNGDIVLFTKQGDRYELLPNQGSYQNKRYILVKGGVIVKEEDNWRFIHDKDPKYDIETWSMKYWAHDSNPLRKTFGSDVSILLQTDEGYVMVHTDRKTNEQYVTHHQIYDPTNINAVRPEDSAEIQFRTGHTTGAFWKPQKVATAVTTALLDEWQILVHSNTLEYREPYPHYWEMTEQERSKLIREARMKRWRAYLNAPTRAPAPVTPPVVVKYTLTLRDRARKMLVATIPDAPDDYLELYIDYGSRAYPLFVRGKEYLSANTYLYIRDGIRVKIGDKTFKWPDLNNELVILSLQNL